MVSCLPSKNYFDAFNLALETLYFLPIGKCLIGIELGLPPHPLYPPTKYPFKGVEDNYTARVVWADWTEWKLLKGSIGFQYNSKPPLLKFKKPPLPRKDL
jgi:hypothetical protein